MQRTRIQRASHPQCSVRAADAGRSACIDFIGERIYVPPGGRLLCGLSACAQHPLKGVRKMKAQLLLQKTSASVPVRTNLLQRKCACDTHTIAGGRCDNCRRTGQTLQRLAINQGEAADMPPIVHEVLRSSGQPLDAHTRSFLEPRFAHDFSRVRVHTDTQAAESARALSAQAYTVGRDVVFGSNQYAPRTREGERLLIHELTHVVQQEGATYCPASDLAVTSPGDSAERQAAVAADALAEGRPVAITQHVAAKIARQELNDETSPSTPAGSTPASRPVFFCSKAVALGQRHAFFRLGGAGPGNSTFELEHDEYGDHCRCGIQGWPTRDYPEDRDSADARCIPAPMITEACLVNNWSNYPIGKYCALGPNSNTYARVLAENCGARGLRPPGSIPGFNDPPPPNHTANPAMDARITFLPGACQTIDCDDRTCDEIYF